MRPVICFAVVAQDATIVSNVRGSSWAAPLDDNLYHVALAGSALSMWAANPNTVLTANGIGVSPDQKPRRAVCSARMPP